MTDTQIGILATAITGGAGLLGRALVAAFRAWRDGQLAVAAELFEVRVFLTALVERDRIREARQRKRDTSPPITQLRTRSPAKGVPVLAAGTPVPGEFDVEETTDITTIMDRQREVLRARVGERKPRAGTHHDET